MSLDCHDGSLLYEIPEDKYTVQYDAKSAPCRILLFLHIFTYFYILLLFLSISIYFLFIDLWFHAGDLRWLSFWQRVSWNPGMPSGRVWFRLMRSRKRQARLVRLCTCLSMTWERQRKDAAIRSSLWNAWWRTLRASITQSFTMEFLCWQVGRNHHGLNFWQEFLDTLPWNMPRAVRIGSICLHQRRACHLAGWFFVSCRVLFLLLMYHLSSSSFGWGMWCISLPLWVRCLQGARRRLRHPSHEVI